MVKYITRRELEMSLEMSVSKVFTIFLLFVENKLIE